MLRRVKNLLGVLRRHLLLSAVAGVLILATAGAAGVHFWAQAQFRAAERAFHGEQYHEAERHILSCLRVWPRSADAHLLAARIERYCTNYDRAAEQLAEAERLQRGASEATQTEWVLLRAQQGELDTVAPGLWYCVENGHPETFMILETLAKTYMRQLRFKTAVATLDRWIELDPGCARAFDWRGWVKERLETPAGAREDYERALRLEPGRFEVRMRLVWLLLDGERFAEARSHLKVLQQSHPDRAEVLIARARSELVNGNTVRARDLLDRVLVAKPEDVAALYWRGQLELEEGDPAVAEHWLRRLLEVDPAHVSGRYALAQALTRLSRPASVVQAQKDRLDQLAVDFRRLKELIGQELEKAPKDAARTAEVGEVFLRLGQQDKGVEWLHKALNLDPNCKRAHGALIEHYEATKQPEEAAKHRLYLSEHGLN